MSNDRAVSKPMLSSEWYDKLKFLAQIGLPAFGTFYFALAALWSLPKSEEVVGTVMAIDVFLGVLLGLSTKQFQAAEAANVQGVVSTNSVDPDTGIPNVGLTITAPLEEVLNSDVIKLKVKNDLPPEARIPG